MGYVTENPKYASADGYAIKYASLDGVELWRAEAVVPPAQTIADFYGVNPGQVPIHYTPETAMLNASQQVTAAPNLSGVATSYLASKTGSNSIYILDGKFHVPTTAPLLNFANAINILNARVFMLINIDPASVGNINFAGRSAGTGDGQRSNFQWVRSTNTLRVIRWNGVSGPAADMSMGTHSPLGTLRLMELRMTNDHMTLWMDGEQTGEVAHTFADYLLGRVMAGYSNPTFTGLMGDVVVMRDDGTPAMDAVADVIRNELADKYGITLVA